MGEAEFLPGMQACMQCVCACHAYRSTYSCMHTMTCCSSTMYMTCTMYNEKQGSLYIRSSCHVMYDLYDYCMTDDCMLSIDIVITSTIIKFQVNQSQSCSTDTCTNWAAGGLHDVLHSCTFRSGVTHKVTKSLISISKSSGLAQSHKDKQTKTNRRSIHTLLQVASCKYA